jgi:hypothetical protein
MRLMMRRALFGGHYGAEAFEHQRYLPMKGWSEKHLVGRCRLTLSNPR